MFVKNVFLFQDQYQLSRIYFISFIYKFQDPKDSLLWV
jgi:hypothetical protein